MYLCRVLGVKGTFFGSVAGASQAQAMSAMDVVSHLIHASFAFLAGLLFLDYLVRTS